MSAIYLTVSEVSEYLKLPEETVYKYARTGRMPASKVGRYWRFEQSKIDDWVDQNSNQSPGSMHVLVVDDDPAVRNILSKWLMEADCHVNALANGNDALRAIEDEDCDLVLLDLLMPSPNGVDTLRSIRSLRPDLEVVIITAYFDSSMMDDALAMGPLTILKKPIDKDELIKLAESFAVRDG
jgi:excisionase family DNA binding protein